MNALSVKDFIEAVGEAFRAAFPDAARVQGEVAEFRVSQGKWVWFKLKDEEAEAVVDCFMTVWDLTRSGLSENMVEDGMVVEVVGEPQVFAKSGRFTLKVSRLKLAREGTLRLAYEKLKAALEGEGVFAVERKRPLPSFPRVIGLVASRESAAYTDFLRILRDRWPATRVLSAHVQVQGEGAPDDIVGAFRWFNAHPGEVEAIVLTRGGGSMEDLMAFNSEAVVRAVFGSRVPVVCAIGHERDVTLADFAADVRAATPTHAAELLVPHREEVAGEIENRRRRLSVAMRHALDGARHRLERSSDRLGMSLRARLDAFRSRLRSFAVESRRFARLVVSREAEVRDLRARLPVLARHAATVAERRLASAARFLQAADPRRPLALGYAIVRREGRLVRSVRGIAAGDALDVEMRDGSIETKVAGCRSQAAD